MVRDIGVKVRYRGSEYRVRLRGCSKFAAWINWIKCTSNIGVVREGYGHDLELVPLFSSRLVLVAHHIATPSWLFVCCLFGRLVVRCVAAVPSYRLSSSRASRVGVFRSVLSLTRSRPLRASCVAAEEDGEAAGVRKRFMAAGVLLDLPIDKL